MRLLAQEEYGLRCLLQVAIARENKPLAISDVAEAEGLSLEYAPGLIGVVSAVVGCAGWLVLSSAAGTAVAGLEQCQQELLDLAAQRKSTG